MATVKAYVTNMLARQQVVARKLGADLSGTPKTARVLNLAIIVLIAAVVKTLTDKGVITDAELLAVLDGARDAAYADEPVEPPPPEPDP